MAKKSKNVIEIEHIKRMMEMIAFLVLAEHTKRKMAKRKQYPNFNMKQSEEVMLKYRIMASQYKADLDKLEQKEQKRLEAKSKKEQTVSISTDAIKQHKSELSVIPEISDEDIEKSISYDSKDPYVQGYINGAKWMREQLKSRQ